MMKQLEKKKMLLFWGFKSLEGSKLQTNRFCETGGEHAHTWLWSRLKHFVSLKALQNPRVVYKFCQLLEWQHTQWLVVDCMSMFIQKMTPLNLLGQSSPVQSDTNHIIFKNVEIFRNFFFFQNFFFSGNKEFDEILNNTSFIKNGLLKIH